MNNRVITDTMFNITCRVRDGPLDILGGGGARKFEKSEQFFFEPPENKQFFFETPKNKQFFSGTVCIRLHQGFIALPS